MEQQTILIVDDDREIVRVIAKILELEGYRTLKAYDGLEALDMLVSNQVAGGQSEDRNGPLSLPGIQSPVRHCQEADEGRRRHDLL